MGLGQESLPRFGEQCSARCSHKFRRRFHSILGQSFSCCFLRTYWLQGVAGTILLIFELQFFFFLIFSYLRYGTQWKKVTKLREQ